MSKEGKIHLTQEEGIIISPPPVVGDLREKIARELEGELLPVPAPQSRLLSDEEMMKALYPNWLITKKDISIWKTEPEYKEIRNHAINIAVHQDAKTYSIAFEAGKKQGMREMTRIYQEENPSSYKAYEEWWLMKLKELRL